MTAYAQQNTRLKIALRSNGVFSVASGLGLAALHNSIASLTGIPFPVEIMAIGISLILFGSVLFAITRNAEQKPSPSIVWAIILGDFSWVVCSILGLALWGSTISDTGIWAVTAVAIVVCGFSTGQTVYLVQRQKALKDHR